MTLDWLHEHDAVTWRLFDVLVRGAEGLWRWPDKPWLPLAFSLRGRAAKTMPARLSPSTELDPDRRC
jgi:hypothetical protein